MMNTRLRHLVIPWTRTDKRFNHTSLKWWFGQAGQRPPSQAQLPLQSCSLVSLARQANKPRGVCFSLRREGTLQRTEYAVTAPS